MANGALVPVTSVTLKAVFVEAGIPGPAGSPPGTVCTKTSHSVAPPGFCHERLALVGPVPTADNPLGGVQLTS